MHLSERRFRSTFLFLIHFYKKQPICFLIFYIAPVVAVFESNVLPYFFKIIIDTISTNEIARDVALKRLKSTFLMIMIISISITAIARLQDLLQAYAIPKFQAAVRTETLGYTLGHSYNYFTKNLSGEIANKISPLPQTLEDIRMFICWSLISITASIIVSLFLLGSVSMVFACIFLLWVATHLLSCCCIGFLVISASKKNAKDISRLNGKIVDLTSNFVSVKLFSSIKDALFTLSGSQFTESASKANLIIKIDIMRLAFDLLLSVALCANVYIAIVKWQQMQITTGDFALIFSIMMGMIDELWYVGDGIPSFVNNLGRAKEALEFLGKKQTEKDLKDAKDLLVKKGNIEFCNVNFSYNKSLKIFSNLSVKINDGQKVGLVGVSGGGKTTFTKLILRFFKPSEGKIKIDEQDIAFVKQDSLRDNISVVTQDPSLFHFSIKENIRYANPSATEKEVIEASKKANCHEFIIRLPNGYETEIGERGVKLSGGQRQRIAIARCILKQAPILIMDEATSALDSITESKIQESMQFVIENRTSIVIAHRLSTIMKMDRILVFSDGKIVEDGAHAELIELGGKYFKMWKEQFSKGVIV